MRDVHEKPARAPVVVASQRWTRWLIAVAAAVGALRLLTLPAMPSFGDNDRSRWATVRALGDHGTYAIGMRRGLDERTADLGIVMQPDWQSVDRVLDPVTRLYYSSKPPLLPTAVAAEYWLLKQICGWAITKQPWAVMVSVLFTFNWLPSVLALASLARTLARVSDNPWARGIALASAVFGTLMTTFLTTLNNHTIAAWALIFMLEAYFLIALERCRSFWLFAACGLCGGWLVANELPALSWLLVSGVALWRWDRRRTLLAFVPAALLPLGAWLLTNLLSVGMLTPVYERMGTVWYNYPGSYWLAPTGIDALSEPKLIYLFNMLFGHHGFFLVSPVLFLGLWGLWQLRREARAPLSTLSYAVVAVSVATFGFYTLRSHNYGGNSAGLRWAIWLLPLWILLLVPGVEALSRRPAGKALCLGLLAVSMYGALVHFHNPWVGPWLERFFGATAS